MHSATNVVVLAAIAWKGAAPLFPPYLESIQQ